MTDNELDRDPAQAIVSIFEQNEIRELAAIKAARIKESLRLYRPQPYQDEFHKSTIRTLLMRKGNQVGGTLALAVELARAVTGQDPYEKYPKRDGVAAVLGYGEKHIGTVFWQKLFMPGAFYVIRDKETRQWRAYRPWPETDGGDIERVSERMAAPPLIPERFIEDVAWEKKNERIFNIVRFTTGWELRAYNSAGDPGQAQGFQADFYGVDEDLANSGWIAEILFRLIAKRGFLRWTALPHGKNDEMLRILDDAEQQVEEGRKEITTKVISVTTYENKFLDAKSVEETVAAAKAQGEDVYEQRIMGKLNIGSTLMYQNFSKRIHTACRTEEPRLDIHRILEDRNGQPPEDWCRYTSTDPGHGVACSLFLATPPPELGDFVVAYDEVYLRGATAETWGDAIEAKHTGHHFQSFLFDEHGGRLTEIGSGKRPRDYYTDQLKQRRIRSETTGYNFQAGSDHIAGREEALREWLSIRRTGYPKLLIVVGSCPMLVWEMERFRKKTIKHSGKDVATDVGNRKVNTHAIENLEMLAAHGCPYVKPAYKPVTTSHVEYVLAARKHREMKRRSLAPGASNYIPLTPLGR